MADDETTGSEPGPSLPESRRRRRSLPAVAWVTSAVIVVAGLAIAVNWTSIRDGWDTRAQANRCAKAGGTVWSIPTGFHLAHSGPQPFIEVPAVHDVVRSSGQYAVTGSGELWSWWVANTGSTWGPLEIDAHRVEGAAGVTEVVGFGSPNDPGDRVGMAAVLLTDGALALVDPDRPGETITVTGLDTEVVSIAVIADEVYGVRADGSVAAAPIPVTGDNPSVTAVEVSGLGEVVQVGSVQRSHKVDPEVISGAVAVQRSGAVSMWRVDRAYIRTHAAQIVSVDKPAEASIVVTDPQGRALALDVDGAVWELPYLGSLFADSDDERSRSGTRIEEMTASGYGGDEDEVEVPPAVDVVEDSWRTRLGLDAEGRLWQYDARGGKASSQGHILSGVSGLGYGWTAFGSPVTVICGGSDD